MLENQTWTSSMPNFRLTYLFFPNIHIPKNPYPLMSFIETAILSVLYLAQQ